MVNERERRPAGAGLWRRLRLGWLLEDPDAGIALIVALAAAVVDLLPGLPGDIRDQVVSSGTLVVVGLLAITLLRGRAQNKPTDEELRELVRTMGEIRQRLPERLDEMTGVLTDARQTLDHLSAVTLLEGSQIRSELADARRTTGRWIFKGGTGTFIRAVTLRECIDNARKTRRRLDIQLEILDPQNATVCEAYSRFRQSMSPPAGQEAWTPRRTRHESYATILAACWHAHRYKPLHIQVGLAATMTTCRWDLSATSVIVTREDPHAQAMMATHDKLFYAWCETELGNSFDQSRKVPIEAAMRCPLSDEPSVEEVRELFRTLGLPLPDSLHDRDVIDITRRALQAADPFP